MVGNAQASRGNGFSLIELLVTIALIAILASLLFPALARAKEKGRQASCMGHLKQFGLAAQMYWDDHDGRTFRYRTVSTNNGEIYWFGWIERGSEGTRRFDRTLGALYPYLGGGVELCPSLPYHSSSFKLKASGASYGYGYNFHLSRPLNEPAFNTLEIAAPSQLALFADAAQINTFQPPASKENPMLEEFYYISRTELTTHFRHGGRANIAMCDGHVGALPPAPGTVDPRLPRARVGRLDERHYQVR